MGRFRGLKDAAKKCGADLSDAPAKALREEMTEAEYENLKEDSTSDSEKAAILESIADRVAKDPTVPGATKENINNAKNACKPKTCPPSSEKGEPSKPPTKDTTQP